MDSIVTRVQAQIKNKAHFCDPHESSPKQGPLKWPTYEPIKDKAHFCISPFLKLSLLNSHWSTLPNESQKWAFSLMGLIPELEKWVLTLMGLICGSQKWALSLMGLIWRSQKWALSLMDSCVNHKSGSCLWWTHVWVVVEVVAKCTK